MADAELKQVFEELAVIYEKLTGLIEVDNDVQFVAIVAQLGKVAGDLTCTKRKRFNERLRVHMGLHHGL